MGYQDLYEVLNCSSFMQVMNSIWALKFHRRSVWRQNSALLLLTFSCLSLLQCPLWRPIGLVPSADSPKSASDFNSVACSVPSLQNLAYRQWQQPSILTHFIALVSSSCPVGRTIAVYAVLSSNLGCFQMCVCGFRTSRALGSWGLNLLPYNLTSA